MDTAATPRDGDHRRGDARLRRAAAMLALLLAAAAPVHATAPLTLSAQPVVAEQAEAEAADPGIAAQGVRVDSAAVRDVFDPLPGISADGAQWRAAVATVPDPVESRLARSFDIEIATLVRSFQFGGYVLQGHAMPWPGPGTPPDDTAPPRPYRSTPGVLVFRHDAYGATRTMRVRARAISSCTWSASRRPSACSHWRSAAPCARPPRSTPADRHRVATTAGVPAWRHRPSTHAPPELSPCWDRPFPVRWHRSPASPATPACTWNS
ncbi:hypothetical protein H1235_07775 [Pseudoxanthomonas sp. NC8]|nr:hypothetical protein H1235_07775 [Pseudoxanthomonas sp. NC8]